MRYRSERVLKQISQLVYLFKRAAVFRGRRAFAFYPSKNRFSIRTDDLAEFLARELQRFFCPANGSARELRGELSA
ncbi:MAG: hypothetical protein ACYC4J_10020 [Gemmatimonadaceae bacterium]